MKSRLVLVAIAVSLLALATPAAADVRNQDPGGGGGVGGTGYEMCWECVPSVSSGFQCRPENIGFNGCQRAVTYTTDPEGNTQTEITCTVIPYGFCVTITP